MLLKNKSIIRHGQTEGKSVNRGSGHCCSICWKSKPQFKQPVWVQPWLAFYPTASYGTCNTAALTQQPCTVPFIKHSMSFSAVHTEWFAITNIRKIHSHLETQTLLDTTTVLGCFIYYFFIGTDDLPYLKCPLHTVLKLTPVAYGKWLHSSKVNKTNFFLCAVLTSSSPVSLF